MPRRFRPLILLTMAAAALTGALVGVSAAKTHHRAVVVRTAHDAKLGKTIVVDSRGRTLYALSSESSKRLLCTPKVCASNWPPLTVRSRSALRAGPGVHGRLATVRRPDGRLQVTLRGMPLYRFAGDSRKGQANGEGLQAFGGTWHAVVAGASNATPPSPGTATTPTSQPAPAPYPGY